MNDLITSQKYLDGEFGIDEKKEFELRLEKDEDLRNDIFIINEIDSFLYNKDLHEFELKVNRLIRENKKSVLYRFYRNKFYIAASVTIMLGFFLYLYITLSKPAVDTIYSRYYTKYDPDIVKRSDTSSENIYLRAISDYINSDYNKAVIKFREMMNLEDYRILASYYTGLCYMELNDYYMALDYFAIINRSDNLFRIHSEWYSALALLKIHKIEESKKILVQIVIENGFYSNQAAEILEALN